MTLLSSTHKRDRILAEMRDLFEQGYGGMFLAGRYSQKVDALLQDIVSSVQEEAQIAFIATGGYGRGELSPFSDIDIMVFAPDRVNTETAEHLLHRLWDTGFTVSHSYRTPEECIAESLKDMRTRTSLLEARYIAGDRELYSVFRNKVYPKIAFHRKKAFVREKLTEMQRRHHVLGDSVFLLEPNIKEGEGGLRDVHTAYWLSKVAFRIETIQEFERFLDRYDYRRFLSAYDFLLRTRFSLHFETGRKNDMLTFDYQRNVSLALGFKDSRKFRASERFMRYYYLKSKAVKELSHKVVARCSRPYITVRRDMRTKKITDDFALSGGQLIARDKNIFSGDPDKIMEVFYLFSKTGKKFSDGMRETIMANLLKINTKTRSSPAAVHFFLEIFKGPRVYETVREIYETGVLGRFIPEFGALRMLVIHEPYHMYTVDEHTLLAVKNLENIRTTKYRRYEDLRDIIKGMEHADTLFLALLLHDIGKAAGRHHEEEGYMRIKNITGRFQLNNEKRHRIEFLVRNHILMSRIALKREISDMEVIARFADAVGDSENLKAIYLMTYADMSAVNPGFLTSWKAYLLKDLFEQTKKYLSGVKEDRTQYLKGLQQFARGIATDDIRKFLDGMPERYLLSTSKEKVIEDFRLVEKAKESGFSMRIDTTPDGVVEIVLSAEDCPGLFSRVVGFLSSKGLNIVNGRIFTGKNGIVLDKIAISNWQDIWWDELEKDLERGLRSILVDGTPVSIVRRSRKAESVFEVFIELDNEASDEYSIIEIFSPDRLGLLYDISNILYILGIHIISARIHTGSGLAQDVFTVRTDSGKINAFQMQELISDLWEILTA